MKNDSSENLQERLCRRVQMNRWFDEDTREFWEELYDSLEDRFNAVMGIKEDEEESEDAMYFDVPLPYRPRNC